MSLLGRQDGERLVVDLRGQVIGSYGELWDALAGPCGLPSWFGRNLDAWWDTIHQGAISPVLDEHPMLVIKLSPRGMFSPGRQEGHAFIETTQESGYGQVHLSATSVQFGCGYCADDQNRAYGHVTQIGSSEARRMILLRCPRCGTFYENTPRGRDSTRRLTENEADQLYPDRVPNRELPSPTQNAVSEI